MKIAKNMMLLAVLLWLVIFTGCKEITTTTVIHRDGTVTRQIEVEGDSSVANDVAYPIPRGEGWTWLQNEREINGEKKKVWTIKKHFGKGDNMIGEMAGLTAEPRRIRLSTDLARITRVFYTYYRYTEGVGSYNVFPVPVTNYVSEDELAMMAAKDSTLDESVIDEIEARYERWQIHAMLEVLFQALKEKGPALETAGLKPADFEEQKDVLIGDLHHAVEESDFDLDTFMKTVAGTMNTPALLSLKDEMAEVWADVEARLEFMHSVEEDSYVFKVEMPGMIVETNADGIEGSKVYWNVHHSQFLNDDFKMMVLSRLPNVGVMIGAGVLGLAAILVLLLPWIRRAKNG